MVLHRGLALHLPRPTVQLSIFDSSNVTDSAVVEVVTGHQVFADALFRNRAVCAIRSLSTCTSGRFCGVYRGRRSGVCSLFAFAYVTLPLTYMTYHDYR